MMSAGSAERIRVEGCPSVGSANGVYDRAPAPALQRLALGKLLHLRLSAASPAAQLAPDLVVNCIGGAAAAAAAAATRRGRRKR